MDKSKSISLFPENTIEEPKRVSFNQVKTYLQCPFRFQQKYLLKREDARVKYYHFLGTVIHSVVRLYNYALTPTQNMSCLLRQLESKWSDRYFADLEQSHYWLGESERMLRHFVSFAEQHGKPVAEESKIKCAFDGFQLNGRLDRLGRDSQGYEIIDFKVGDLAVPDTEMLISNYQWLFYFLCVKQSLMITPNRFTYFFIRANQEVVIEYTNELLDNELPKLKNILTQMFSCPTYIPKKNIYCQDCSFFDECG